MMLSWLGEIPATINTVMAFDFGEKRTGVSVGEMAIASAHPLTIICVTSKAERLRQIGVLLDTWHPSILVVGMPYHADGSPNRLTQLCQVFARQLHTTFARPVACVDERYSSLEAQSYGLDKTAIDALAAQIILQQFFSEYRL